MSNGSSSSLEDEDSEKVIVFQRGEVLFAEGEPSIYFYIVVSGKVGIFIEDKGKLNFINTVGEKDFLGEMSLFTNRPRGASAIALEETVVLPLKKIQIKKVLKMCPPWVSDIMVTLTRRLRNTVNILKEHEIVDEFYMSSLAAISREDLVRFKQGLTLYRKKRKL